MPPHKIQHLANATFSNIEHQGLEYDRDTLDPWADKLRAEIEFKLLTPTELDAGVHAYINLNALMRADLAARTAHYKEMYYMSAYSPNRILELEDENPVPFGDRHYVQSNMVPVAMAGQTPGAAPAPDPDDTNNVQAGFRQILAAKIHDLIRGDINGARKSKDPVAFLSTREAYIAEHMAPYISAVMAGLGVAGDARAMSVTYAAIHCAETRQQLSNDIHDDNRAATAAADLMEAIQCNTDS
jgi:hypothetical protein